MSNNPTQNPIWDTLKQNAEEIKTHSINDLFVENSSRFEEFSLEIEDLFFDYSKQYINKEALKNLYTLLRSSNIEAKRQEMFDGVPINRTEGRSVLHTALRRSSSDTVEVNGKNVIPEIHDTLKRIKTLSEKIKNKELLGATGKPIEKIISIGIGGSDLGARMVYQALSNNKANVILPCHFVSNVDGDDILEALEQCHPETTLVIIISKTFTTQETLTNARVAQDWFKERFSTIEEIMAHHFVAVSANPEQTKKFGIVEENFFPMWEWVNGRFSLWSAVGLPLALSLGYENFEALLDGARIMDEHFLNAPLEKNMPVLMALLGIWNRNFLKSSHHAVLPYSQRLKDFPAYLQQLDMESNGKSIDSEGQKITDYETAPVLFGEAGTNGQHSFYQLLHQGSDIIPCDFIAAIEPDNALIENHTLLLSHMLAQGQAMMQGRHDYKTDEPYRYFSGNKPSSTILIKELNAKTLGMLIALYEHKVFVQGIVWNINSFDQYGVELGKELSQKITAGDLSDIDPSTAALLSYIHKSLKAE